MTPVFHLPAHVLREEITNKRLSAEALTKIYLDRIEAIGGKNGVNAIAEIDETEIGRAHV